VVRQARQPPGDPVAVRIVLLPELRDQGRDVRADVVAPRGGLRVRGGDRRRVDRQDLVGVPFEQGAERAAGAADAERGDLLQVEQPLGLLRGDHPPL
jgi:hypothetical protein